MYKQLLFGHTIIIVYHVDITCLQVVDRLKAKLVMICLCRLFLLTPHYIHNINIYCINAISTA